MASFHRLSLILMTSCAGLALAACDGHFSIAQFGSTRSINAAAAAAIAMHAWVRQHAFIEGA